MSGLIIKKRRKELKLTMKELASMTCVSEGTVSRWESGHIKDMKKDKIILLSRALGLSPIEIIAEDDAIETDFPKERMIPLVGTVACGLPILAEENIEEYIPAPYDVKADFCLRCKGDSMINARIMDGDIVFVKRTEEFTNGQIAVVLIDNEATLKRVYKYPDSLILNAENPAYKPIIISGNDLSVVRIEGIAVSFLSSLN